MDLIPGLPFDVGLECLVRIPHHYFSSVSSVCKSWKRQIQLPEFWRHRKSSGLTRKVVVLAQARVDPTREQGAKKYGAAPVYRLTVCEPETGFGGTAPDSRVFRRVADVLPGGRGRVEISGDGRVGPGDVGGLEWCVHLRLYLRHVAARGRHARPPPPVLRVRVRFRSDGVRGGRARRREVRPEIRDVVRRGERRVVPPARHVGRARRIQRGLPRREIPRHQRVRDERSGRFGTSAESLDVATRRWGPVQEDFWMRPRVRETARTMGAGSCSWRAGPTWRSGGIVRVASRGGAAVGREKHGVRDGVAGETAGDWIERFGAPYKTYLLDLKRCKWEKVEADEEFSGHVQSGCCLEL
ncbi:hypothetical protein DH2020_016430 [Rehmannia glutinosa]|uniref:F-box domain-containing protein n=1 Tax=Rehmannia glutinosa TaxID=99300 RepID=A0ABR0WS81_REHGL